MRCYFLHRPDFALPQVRAVKINEVTRCRCRCFENCPSVLPTAKIFFLFVWKKLALRRIEQKPLIDACISVQGCVSLIRRGRQWLEVEKRQYRIPARAFSFRLIGFEIDRPFCVAEFLSPRVTSIAAASPHPPTLFPAWQQSYNARQLVSPCIGRSGQEKCFLPRVEYLVHF